MEVYHIENQHISFDELEKILASGVKVELGETAKQAILKCRLYLDKKIEQSEGLIYGINTGFGSLCNTAISKEDLSQLQRNLVLSHSCGMGEEVPHEIVKRMLLLKVLGLSKGNSGVQLQTVSAYYFSTMKIFFLSFTSKEAWVRQEI